MTPRSFEGQRALVTGASRGIGAGVAERLAAEGAPVAITARTLDRREDIGGSLGETAARLASYGIKVATVVADLTDETDRARIVPEAVATRAPPSLPMAPRRPRLTASPTGSAPNCTAPASESTPSSPEPP